MKKLLILAFSLLSASMFAQQIVVFDQNSGEKTTLTKDNKGGDYNAVKWDYGMLMRGAFVVNYERKINNYMTAEAGVGLTYFDLYHYALTLDDASEMEDVFGSYTKIKAGFYGSLSLKFFPKELDYMDGFYLAPLLRYRTYNSQTKIDGYKFDRGVTAKEVGFVVGWQYENSWDMFCSAYIGVGYQMKDYDMIRANDAYDSYDNYYTDYSLEKLSDSTPILMCGFTVGFTF
ncbi:MAG: hypothetical protein LBR81_05920 [Prevotellaceae bacterium]|jgi:hypothetical protein|nr:hypothetical protein [Prevotellaceae bacterium]